MSMDPKTVERVARVTRFRLGYTPSEMKEVLDSIKPVETLRELRAELTKIEKKASFKAMDGKTLKEARDMFGLTAQQFGPLLGFKVGASIRSTMSALERGRMAVSEPVTRLARAYHSGYRPPDWPHDEGRVGRQ